MLLELEVQDPMGLLRPEAGPLGGAGVLASVSGQGVALVELLLGSHSLCVCDAKSDTSGVGNACGQDAGPGKWMDFCACSVRIVVTSKSQGVL